MTGAEKPAGQRARQLFLEGRNCAQSVLGAFAPGSHIYQVLSNDMQLRLWLISMPIL